MSIVLGGITLPALWFVTPPYLQTGIIGATLYADDGTPIVSAGDIGELDLSLMGGPNSGFITKAVLVLLKALAVVKDTTFTLSYEGDIYTVRFKHEDGNPISANLLVGRPSVSDGDYFNNVLIKLMGE